MMPEPIHSLQTYNARMSKSLWDKAFFADKIPGAKLIIDYGCADGSLMDFIQKNFPEFMTVGLDANEEMVRLRETKDCPHLQTAHPFWRRSRMFLPAKSPSCFPPCSMRFSTTDIRWIKSLRF